MPDSLLKPIHLGSLTIRHSVTLAPMSGVTSWPFRLLCKEQGCGLVMTEFVSDKALLYGSQRTREMIRLLPEERPAGIQIFGADPDTMARAAARIVELEAPDVVDINMGCPAPKVTKGRGGSSLLKEPERAEEIIRQVVRAVAPVPVTVKMRIGWDSRSINAVEMARRAEDAGAQMITVHGRTREQQYSGRADWDVIAQVARAVQIPVLGNGDITTPQEAAARLRESGCAGVAIARGSLGNPWIFSRTIHYLETGELLPEPPVRERVAMALRHLDLLIQYRGEYLAVREMRKHAAWYIKGLWGATEMRQRINQAETPEEMRSILLAYRDHLEAVGKSRPQPDGAAEIQPHLAGCSLQQPSGQN